ncbi:MAG: hypothetical protein ACTS4T_01425 [Candidatus Hodgkinia cicadicola]
MWLRTQHNPSFSPDDHRIAIPPCNPSGEKSFNQSLGRRLSVPLIVGRPTYLLPAIDFLPPSNTYINAGSNNFFNLNPIQPWNGWFMLTNLTEPEVPTGGARS